MRGKVERCGINTSKLQTLKSDEVTQLLRQAKDGDTQAREKLIYGNLRLVLSVVQKFLNRGENVDDLFQVGCIGLMKAIDNFDINQPVRFSTYGVPMIVGEIRRYLRDNSAIRVSRSMRDTAYKVLQAREKLMENSQREPTVEQIAQYLEIPREDVVFAMDAIVDPVSLYEPIYSDGCHLRDGSGQGHGQYRRKLDRAVGAEGGPLPPERPGAPHSGNAVLRGQDADGGVRGDRHFPGAGQPPGKGRHRRHQKAAVTCAGIASNLAASRMYM